MEQAPGLVVQWCDYAYCTQRGIDKGEPVFGEDLHVAVSEFPHTGTHRLEGVFIAKRPLIRRWPAIYVHTVDLAPTILYILGEAIASNLDGKVLPKIFEKKFSATWRVKDEK